MKERASVGNTHERVPRSGAISRQSFPQAWQRPEPRHCLSLLCHDGFSLSMVSFLWHEESDVVISPHATSSSIRHPSSALWSLRRPVFHRASHVYWENDTLGICTQRGESDSATTGRGQEKECWLPHRQERRGVSLPSLVVQALCALQGGRCHRGRYDAGVTASVQ